MYNEDRKKRYLDETKKSQAFGMSIFRSTEPVEEQYGVDLALLPKEAMQSIINERLGIRTRSLSTAISFIKSYFLWCKESGFEVGDGIDGITIQNFDKIRESMVSSPKHLDILMDKVFDPVQEETVDCVYRCFLWMAFSGLSIKDAVDVKASEIDFDQMLIRHGEGQYELYRESIPAFKKACECTEFVYIHPDYKNKIRRNRYDGEYIMRGIRSEKISPDTLRSNIGKRVRASGLKLSYNRLHLSGVFYRAYEMERAGFQPDFSGIAIDTVNSENRTYRTDYLRKRAISSIEQTFMNDYVSWKQAFS